MGCSEYRKLPHCYRDLINEEPDGYDSALEKALCREPFFREQRLRLFRGVALAWLQPAPGAPSVKGEWAKEQMSYLLCQGSRPLLMFQVSWERRKGAVPNGLLTLSFQREAGAEVPLAVLRRSVERLLSSDEAVLWDYPMEPVPNRFWPQLVREGLVERDRQGDQLGWSVSAAGHSQGLSWLRWFEGGRSREGPAWSGQARRTLEPMWTTDPQGRRSLAGRLRELELGCGAGQAVERFARARLEAYLCRCPEELRELEKALGVGPDAPFHQAAALIQDRLCSGDRRVREEGTRLMRLLARPISQ